MKYLVHHDGTTWETDVVPPEVKGDGFFQERYPGTWVSEDGRGAAYQLEPDPPVRHGGGTFGHDENCWCDKCRANPQPHYVNTTCAAEVYIMRNAK